MIPVTEPTIKLCNKKNPRWRSQEIKNIKKWSRNFTAKFNIAILL